MNRQRSIELYEDVDFQRRQWRWQRFGWVLMCLFAAAGLLGYFGDGPYSAGVASSTDGALRLDYERFARRDAVSRLRVTLAPQALVDGHVELRVGNDYLRNVQIHAITPEPEQSIAGAEDVAYRFAGAASGRELVIWFVVETQKAGMQQLRIGASGGTGLAARQLVFP